jgi:hypothetical protein
MRWRLQPEGTAGACHRVGFFNANHPNIVIFGPNHRAPDVATASLGDDVLAESAT